MYLQVLESELKVENWLFQHEESGKINVEGNDESLELLKTWVLDHVLVDSEYLRASNRLTVSESGAIGISCDESPSLSVMYSDTEKAPVILSDHSIYRSATFVKISGKEYLAAAGGEDGCLYLWDIESKDSKKVFDPKLPSGKSYGYMIIFKIDENTIGYAEVMSLHDGSRRVFILKTGREQWSLSSTLWLFIPRQVWDICYTKIADGTPCLFLCIPHDQRIIAVEMVGGRTRWEVGPSQMGEKCKPWSVSTDDNTNIYVADFSQRKIHLLSAADGTVIKRFDPGNVGVRNVFTVRFHEQHLYVKHKILKSKYAVISGFQSLFRVF